MVYTYNKSADIDLHIDLWYKNVNVLCYCVITSKVLRSPPRHGWPLWNIYVTNDHGYVPPVVNTSRSFPHSWLITRFVTILTRQVPPVEQELFTFREHMSSPPFFSGVRVTRSLLLCVCFVDCCLSFCTFFCHCFVCSSSIYGLWLPLWYLQTLPKKMWIFFIIYDVTSGAGITYHAGVHPHFLWGSFYSTFCFMFVFCRLLFVLFSFIWPLKSLSSVFEDLLPLCDLPLKFSCILKGKNIFFHY
jgi:hypothetical protein